MKYILFQRAWISVLFINVKSVIIFFFPPPHEANLHRGMETCSGLRFVRTRVHVSCLQRERSNKMARLVARCADKTGPWRQFFKMAPSENLPFPGYRILDSRESSPQSNFFFPRDTTEQRLFAVEIFNGTTTPRKNHAPFLRYWPSPPGETTPFLFPLLFARNEIPLRGNFRNVTS